MQAVIVFKPSDTVWTQVLKVEKGEDDTPNSRKIESQSNKINANSSTLQAKEQVQQEKDPKTL